MGHQDQFVPQSLEQLLMDRGGVLFRSELAGIGIGQDRLHRAIQRGEWCSAGRRLVVHHTAPTGLVTDTIIAARLNPGATLTGASAALLNPHPAWAGRDFSGQSPMIIVPRQRPGPWRAVRHPGATSDTRHGFAVANHHTTLIDLLRFMPWCEAAAIAGSANQMAVTTHEQLRQSVKTLKRVDGAGQLQMLARAMVNGAESGPEVDLHQALHRAQIRGWMGNPTIKIGDRLVRPDIAFMQEKVAVEYDGLESHSGEPAFHDDRDRLRAMQLWGWLVLPITKRTLYDKERLSDLLGDLRGLRSSRRGGAIYASKPRRALLPGQGL